MVTRTGLTSAIDSMLFSVVRRVVTSIPNSRDLPDALAHVYCCIRNPHCVALRRIRPMRGPNPSRTFDMPKGTQKGNKEIKKPKQAKKPAGPASPFIPAQGKINPPGSGKK